MYSQLSVGERLKVARKAAGFTQDELGNLIKVGKSQISNIEKGTSELTRANAIVFTEHLGISLNWLLQGTGEMHESKAAQQGIAGRDQAQGGKNATLAGRDMGVAPKDDNRLALAEKEIEHLRERLADKEKEIAFLKTLIK